MSKVFRLLSQGADPQEGERKPAQNAPKAPLMQIGETLEWWKVSLFDRRDMVFVDRLSGQFVKQCIDQNLGASFEALPLDDLCGIVKCKRVKDRLGIDFLVSVTSVAGQAHTHLGERPIIAACPSVPGLHPMHNG